MEENDAGVCRKSCLAGDRWTAKTGMDWLCRGLAAGHWNPGWTHFWFALPTLE